MRQNKQLRLVTLLALTLLLTGCATSNKRTIELHPISDKDIFQVPAGTTIGAKTTEQDGWFLSDYWLEEIANVKVGKARLGTAKIN